MKFIGRQIIELHRELSELDKFTLDFVRILRKHPKYVLISGYVSILLGRARSSEDVDIIIPKLSLDAFSLLLSDLIKADFYCLNAEKQEDIYDYLKDKLAVRFAKNNTVIPNIYFKFENKKKDDTTLDKTITVKLDSDELIISHLELQIAFKEVVLKSPKDIEDARHIRNIANNHLDKNLIKKYEVMLHDF